MALSDAQKTSFVFKKGVAAAAETSLSRDFFEEPYVGRDIVLPSQVWNQADQIPNTAPTLADGDTSGVVQYFSNRSMTPVAGAPNAFYLSDLVDAIPSNYGDGTSYTYSLKTSTNGSIAFGSGDWVVNNAAGTLIFYGALPTVPSTVSAALPPKITFYKYIGTKGVGSGSGGGGSVTIKDQNSILGTAVTSINFVGAAITATGDNTEVTVNVEGVQGSTGFQGPSGGPQGSVGFQGIQGRQGTTGTQGNQGIQGLLGPQGPADGPQGATGAQGTQGRQGIQGTTGTQGSQGTQGLLGFQGPADGPQGSQGVQGGPGAQGSQGILGSQGTSLTPGLAYNYDSAPSSGPNTGGVRFSSSNISVSTTVYISNVDAFSNSSTSPSAWNLFGSSVSRGKLIVRRLVYNPAFLASNDQIIFNVTNVTTTGNYYSVSISSESGSLSLSNGEIITLDFSPTGIQGSQGTQGRQGTLGIQGPSGGPQGSQGIQGVGSQGNQGFQGRQGISGTATNQGATGSQGSQGSQGTQGFPGLGSQGLTGPVITPGHYYLFDTGTAAGTGFVYGHVRYNNTTLSSVTQIYINKITYESVDLANIIPYLTFVDSYIYINQQIYPLNTPTSFNSHIWKVTGAINTNGSGDYITIPVTLIEAALPVTNFSNIDALSVSFSPKGAQGIQGLNGLFAGQGAQGTQGTTGTQGIQGRQGTIGTTGSQGSQGTTGTQGIQGAGVQGTQGAGVQGTQGTTGLQGIQGSANGPQGAQGTSGAGGGVTNSLAIAYAIGLS